MADQTIVVNLKPRGSHILGGIANLGEVDKDWTVVVTSNSLGSASPVTRLLVHLNSDSATSRNGTDTRNTSSTASVTSYIIRGDTADWGVAEWRTDTGTSLVNTIHPELLESSMGRGSRCGGEEAGEEGVGDLHSV